eukprot:m.69731 g.69731  ORF g.69731 m.69731 type:complete len:105 (+) comp35625_c0_seq21:223-537(+)
MSSSCSTNAVVEFSLGGAHRKPIQTVQGADGPLYTLISAKGYLISGGSSGISLWKWDSLIKRDKEDEKLQPVWSAQIFARSSRLPPEVNCLSYLNEVLLLLHVS